MVTSPEPAGWGWVLPTLALLALGCAPAPEAAPRPTVASSWSVTAWGEHFEVFPEAPVLSVGTPVTVHTHVTQLDGFRPLAEGSVRVVLAGPAGEQVFAADPPTQAGVFAVPVTPEAAGDHELLFRLDVSGVREEIRGGRLRVGEAGTPGAQLVAPAPRGALETSEPLPFLKEEQWQSDFGTRWVRTGSLARSYAGLARVRPVAGGEVVLGAPVDGVVRPSPRAQGGWPYPGLTVDRGAVLFEVAPRVAAEQSLASLEAAVARARAELAPAEERLGRLRELLTLDATSEREVAESQARVESLQATLAAAERDLGSAQAARGAGPGGSRGGEGVRLTAPFSGQVAVVPVSPGATVSAGEPLARLVRTDTVWLEILLSPQAARQLATEGVGGVVLGDPESQPLRLDAGVRWVSMAPEVDPTTRTVAVLLEVEATPGLSLGATFDAQVLGQQERQGTVIPASALVDDGGVSVVYLQLAGERFVRQQVRVVERQGDRLLVEGLVPGQRLVHRGGDAIRRSTLMATGSAHGHVH